MGIEVVWRGESGNELERINDAREFLSTFVQDPAPLARTLCLRFIDPYGDACFNQLQLPVLAHELELVTSIMEPGELRNHLQSILALVKRATEIHTYVWFVGD